MELFIWNKNIDKLIDELVVMWEFVFWESRRVKHLDRREHCKSVKVFNLPAWFSFHGDRGVLLINDGDSPDESLLIHPSEYHERHEVDYSEEK